MTRLGGSTANAVTEEFEPLRLRRAIRRGWHHGPTSGIAPGYLQGNLAILPERLADAFFRYCQLNPRPCPLIGVSEPGSPLLPHLGAELDIRTDLPGYRVFRGDQEFEQVSDLTNLWRDDLVTFVLGCSFSFEDAILRAGIPLRHITAESNVPMYVTSIQTNPAGDFHGALVVSMRSFAPADAIKAIIISERQRLAHGAPVHIGDPEMIGIADLAKPDFGDPPALMEGDIPLFWACGVTPQMAILNACPDLAITHEPGHMLVTDLPSEAAEFTVGGIGPVTHTAFA